MRFETQLLFYPSCTVLDEIEERRQFLEEMNALGKGSQYHHIINTEISQVTHTHTLYKYTCTHTYRHLKSRHHSVFEKKILDTSF